MATFGKTATFTVDGVWGTAGNWTPANKPVSTDDVIFIGNTFDVAGSDESLVTLGSLAISDGWKRKIGASGTPMRINATDGFFNSAGAETWIDGAFTDLYIDSLVRGTNAFQLNTANANTIATLHILRGRCVTGGNCTVTTLNTAGNRLAQAFVDIANGATATTVNHNGGSIVTAGTSTTFNQFGGLTTESTGGSVTTLNLFGGTYTFNEGTCTTVNLHGGLFDLSRGTAQKTISTINYFGGEYRLQEKPNLAGTLTINIHAAGPHGLAPGTTITVT